MKQVYFSEIISRDEVPEKYGRVQKFGKLKNKLIRKETNIYNLWDKVTNFMAEKIFQEWMRKYSTKKKQNLNYKPSEKRSLRCPAGRLKFRKVYRGWNNE